eukprot:10967553-Karenia_brevis.AAC.1
MIRRPPRSTHCTYRRQRQMCIRDRDAYGGTRSTEALADNAGTVNTGLGAVSYTHLRAHETLSDL